MCLLMRFDSFRQTSVALLQTEVIRKNKVFGRFKLFFAVNSLNDFLEM